ncbi:cell division protein FtsK [Microbacterium testaceum]|uniref:cell division protein FtsK n=1 Tax=Microbacterium testaceum TaxID=2033 RepID=UPI002AC42F17|nr:cell division protein FtsK [Microbacterium testaceum]MDZ5146364.1 cell division protein FtsK [Microbacterium testaceum]
MSRLSVPGSRLSPRPTPWITIAIVILLVIATCTAAHLADADGLAVLAGVVAALLVAAIVTVYLRNSARQDTADLYLLRVHGILGWPDPSRDQVRPSRYRGGWVGSPTRLTLVYNPLVDEDFPEMMAETRRLAQRAFGARFNITKHRRNKIILTATTSANERERDEKIERTKLIIAKTFGAGATTTVETSSAAPAPGAPAATRITGITVKYEVAPKLSRSGIRASLEAQISGVLEGRWRAFWDLSNDTVRMELRPDLPTVIPNPCVAPTTVDPLATYDALAVPIGVDEDGNTISWRPKHDAHLLTTGKTGKGKTVCLLTITEYLAAHGWEVWGIDGKRFEMLGLRSWENVRLIAGRVDHQARVAHKVYEEMQRRMAAYEDGEVRLEDFVPLLFVIDEFKTFRNALLRWYRVVKPKGPGSQPPVLDEISDIASLGRKMRIHIVIGLQRPDADFLTGDMRDNFAFRISWGRLSAEAAKMMWNDFVTGTTIPIDARGRGIAYNRHGQPVEIQGYWTPDPYQTTPDRPDIWVFPNDLQLVENLRPTQRIHPLMRIVDPEEIPDLEGDGAYDLTYYDFMDARVIPAGDPELDERARAISARVNAEVREERASARVALLSRIQEEEEEVEIPDEAEMFNGYSPAADQFPEEILSAEGNLAVEGLLMLVDAGEEKWGLVEYAEHDLDDDSVTISYRDFATGEPGATSVPTDNTIITRSPLEHGA